MFWGILLFVLIVGLSGLGCGFVSVSVVFIALAVVILGMASRYAAPSIGNLLLRVRRRWLVASVPLWGLVCMIVADYYKVRCSTIVMAIWIAPIVLALWCLTCAQFESDRADDTDDSDDSDDTDIAIAYYESGPDQFDWL